MIAHNPRNRIRLLEVLKKLETIETEEMYSSQEEKERENSESMYINATSHLARDRNGELLLMNEDHLILGNVRVKLKKTQIKIAITALVFFSKDYSKTDGESAVDTLNDAQTKVDENCFLNERPMDKGNVPCETTDVADPNVLSTTPDDEITWLAVKAKKIAFHPILPHLLCCETVEGDLLLLKMSDSSFSYASCLTQDKEKLKGAKKYSLNWNVKN